MKCLTPICSSIVSPTANFLELRKDFHAMEATFNRIVSLLHKDGKKENKGVRAKEHSPRIRKMMAQEGNTDKVQKNLKGRS